MPSSPRIGSLPALLGWALLAAPAQAQFTAPYQVVPGQADWTYLGQGLDALDDVDGDGVADYALGAPQVDTPVVSAGAVYVHSGRDGTLLRTTSGSSAYEYFGATLAALGDVDGDGIGEYAVGAYGEALGAGLFGRVSLFSGASGAQLWSVPATSTAFLGASLAAAGDVDADGTPDLVVGASGGNGEVVVLSGSSGAVLATWTGQDPSLILGYAVAGVGDLDGDGHDDVLATSAAKNTSVYASVEVFSGRTGGTLLSFVSPKLADGFGSRAAGLGDVDGDGIADFAVTAGKGARLRVFSGRDGSVVWSLFHTVEEVAAAGDWNGDGLADVAVGDSSFWNTPFLAAGRVVVYSGPDKAVLSEFVGAAENQRIGSRIAATELNGDGKPDLLVGAPLQKVELSLVQSLEGGAFAYLGGCELVAGYCTAGTSASGCTAEASASGIASSSASSGFVVQASGVEGGTRGLFLFGTNGRQAAPWGNGTSFQCVQPPVNRGPVEDKSGAPGVCDGSFARDLNARWTAKPNQRPEAGDLLQVQFWYRDPASTSNQVTSLSDAIEVTVCP